MTSSDFEGRVALVTGGAKGIGRACCEQLAVAGAKVGVRERPGRARSGSGRLVAAHPIGLIDFDSNRTLSDTTAVCTMSLPGHRRATQKSALPVNILVLKSWVHPGFVLCLAIFFTCCVQAQTADTVDAGLSQKQISQDSGQAQDEVAASGKSSEESPQASVKATPAEISRPPADSPAARPPGGTPFYRYRNVAERLPLEAPFLTKALTKWLSLSDTRKHRMLTVLAPLVFGAPTPRSPRFGRSDCWKTITY